MAKNKDVIQLIKTVKCVEYVKGRQQDTLIKILRNENTNEKHVEIIEDPEITYYINKDEYITDIEVDHIEIDKVEPITAKSAEIVKSVAYATGNEDYFWKCIKNKKFGLAKTVHLDPNVHGSDVDVEDYYIGKHYLDHPISDSKNYLSKGFFDIEVDTIDSVGFPDPQRADCEINALGYFNDENMTFYGLYLNNSRNPLIDELKQPDNLKAFRKRMKAKYKEEHGIDIKLKLVWFDDELELITSFYFLVHQLKPDFMGAWNLTQFDKPYIINRIINLGGSPEEVLCHPDIPYKYYKLDIDTRNQDPADKGSYFQVTDYTNWQDQLLLFANLRKGAGKRESYSLDSIAFEEIKANKLEFKNPNTTMKTSCYDDYEEFVEYNMHDTILLYLIEKRNKDFDMIYSVAAKTETRIIKALKKTICIKNLARRFYYNLGYIMSNNHNATYGNMNAKEKKSFRGAFVGNSNKNKALGKLINGLLSKYIFDNVVDFDLSSLYPSLILAFNIDATTQIGLISLEDSDVFGRFTSDEFADDLITKDFLYIANKYFNLPSVDTFLNILDGVC